MYVLSICHVIAGWRCGRQRLSSSGPYFCTQRNTVVWCTFIPLLIHHLLLGAGWVRLQYHAHSGGWLIAWVSRGNMMFRPLLDPDMCTKHPGPDYLPHHVIVILSFDAQPSSFGSFQLLWDCYQYGWSCTFSSMRSLALTMSGIAWCCFLQTGW